ncbi:Mur ligase family protein [Streptomyces apocyni]|uniref:Mur ligase family protein n=1 Tax=Streptomyces apocyni TaxID=2654677 RepID=UPI001E4C16C6|nr:Mur ligase family protein [Streptomyces apocyni]
MVCGVGHITHLTRIAPPTVGLVLDVGTAHVGEFVAREQIAKAKGERVEALLENGLAVLNADDPLVAAMASRTPAKVLTFGTSNDADVRAVDVALDASGRASFTLAAADAQARVDLSPAAVRSANRRCGGCSGPWPTVPGSRRAARTVPRATRSPTR